MTRVDWTSLSLFALVAAAASLMAPAASAQTGAAPRSPASDSRVASAQGKDVRVTTMDGSRRTGKLVSLSASEVVFRQEGKDVSVPLEKVRKIERVSRGVRNGVLVGVLVGTLGGTLAANSWLSESGCPPDCVTEEGRLLSAGMGASIGAGIGAGIGALINSGARDRNLLYLAPGSSGTVSVAPIMSQRRQGVALTMRW